MVIRLAYKQRELLRKIAAGTAFEQAVSSFPAGLNFDVDRDLLGDLRELCAEVEVDSVQNGGGVIRDEDGRIAVELVDLLFTG